MSILKKPYEISVWDDVWNPTLLKFEEKRLGVIGSNNMSYQGRAIEPNLTRNVNGVKKFSFKMYRYFVDTETGEKVENPFIEWLVSERKIKLQYNNKWYDFIIKNINENSSNHLYTYQLEDALVQELSKNGFGITLDAKLMNNMGTAGELADYVLNETDWDVVSEALVEKVEDNLVYINIPDDTKVYPITDQSDLSTGIITEEPVIISNGGKGWDVLAFYTSCTSKPHRFQFIYIPTGYRKEESGKFVPSVSTDENQIINVKDCQYYCEINMPEADGVYTKVDTFSQFYLPTGFRIIDFGEDDISNEHDTTISVWYRGYRYGFAQSTKYIPVLDKYCNIYLKNGTKYYGYIDNDYKSPVLLQNIITNTDFKGTTGWVGTYDGKTANAKATYGANVEAVYGRFDKDNVFSSVLDELSNGSYSSDVQYTTYLKVALPKGDENNTPILINTGFYDNRISIGEVDYDEEWYFEPTILASDGSTLENLWELFDFKLREVSFDPNTGAYKLGKIWAEVDGTDKLKFNSAPPTDVTDKQSFLKDYADVKISKKDFKKKEIKLVITPNTTGEQIYYIKDMQLFKLIFSGNEIIKPGDLDAEGVIQTTYRLFPASYVEEDDGSIKEDFVDVETIVYENLDKTKIDYNIYIPQYNEGAQKVRSVDAKESNYFNILQSIAEKFEAWLELEIGRDAQGSIISKTVKFKNYAGKDNYASFRYGVNLKDIQRTYESKNIVTKLIVKQNSNEHAKNGFCTIARAGANQTGENYIYDFRYYHDKGMLNKTEYVASLYYSENIYHEGLVEAGPDITEVPCADPSEHGQKGHNCYNLQNYFNRIKNLNIKIQDINKVLTPLQTELIKLKAELTVQEGLRETANQESEAIREDFQTLTGLTPETISYKNWIKIECEIPEADDKYGINNLNGEWAVGAKIQENHREEDILTWTFDITLTNNVSGNKIFKFQPLFKCYYNNTNFITVQPIISCDINDGEKTGYVEHQLVVVDVTSSSVSSLLTKYAVCMAQYNDANKKIEGYKDGDGTVKGLAEEIEEKEKEIKDKQEKIKALTEHKKELNKLFYSRYSRFIQEGTWIDEKYIDDDKYYADAQSVMYNSCYPQVAYTINVLALSALPGYEHFEFELGDKTYVIDLEFFGEDRQEEVIINEISENLDDPSRNQIKVQNFKNQFQDLFQKITATVQQTQYSTGSYQKAVALAEASAAVKSEFLQEAFNNANNRLSNAGQTTVEWGDNGITLTDSATKDQMRLIGGAILMSVEDQNGQRKWKTGLTPDGISASLITAGTVDTGKIQIKNGKDITFLWNAFGLSAFDIDWDNGEISGAPDTSKFVRFDKYGIYGMDISSQEMKDGTSWKPEGFNEIDSNATFALTWEGLKITGGGETTLRIGKHSDKLIDAISSKGTLFSISTEGVGKLAGWTIAPGTGYSSGIYTNCTVSYRPSTEAELITEAYRVGMKRETQPETFAFYVKTFSDAQISAVQNKETTYDDIVQPLGKTIFGVRYNGEMLATAGEIAGWTIEPNGLVKINDGTRAHAIYSKGSKDFTMMVPTYKTDGSFTTDAINVLVQFGQKSSGKEYKETFKKSTGEDFDTKEEKTLNIGLDFPLQLGATYGKFILNGEIVYSDGSSHKIKEITLSPGVKKIFEDYVEKTDGDVTSYIPTTFTVNWPIGANRIDISCVVVNNETRTIHYRFEVNLELTSTVSYYPCLFSENGDLSINTLMANTGKIGEFTIYNNGSIGFNGTATYPQDTNYSSSGFYFYAGDALAVGSTTQMDYNGFKVYTGKKNPGKFTQVSYHLASLTKDELALNWYAYESEYYLGSGYGLKLDPGGLYWRETSRQYEGNWPSGGYRESTVSITMNQKSDNDYTPTDLTFKIPAGTVKVSDLVFKGPYDIRYGSASGTVVGKLYRMGPLVYGVILDNYGSRPTAGTLFYFTEEGKTISVTIPGPSGDQSISWFPNGDNYLHEISIQKDGTKLKMSVGSASANPTISLSAHHYSYFVYSANSTQHPNS